MKKTLLFIFIHGFKGGDQTFEKFPEHLCTLVSDALPNLNVVTAVYPKFETRGDLTECVARFKEWLQNKVIDLEVAAKTPSPTVDPSVRTILIGHSMGGIVAAETLISIANDQPVPSARTAPMNQPESRNNTTEQTNTASDPSRTVPHLGVPEPLQRSSSAPPAASNAKGPSEPPKSPKDDSPGPSFLFPYIQGILAFDTPYLGIHPGVVAHGAESHYNSASAAMNAYNSATKFFGGGKSSAAAVDTSRSLPSSTSSGGGWGKYALYAGGAAALAAVGGAAYANRNHLATGWKWGSDHLVFVGCLARGAELSQRVDTVAKLSERYGIGFADLYTKLGSRQGETKVAGQLLGEERTFCVVPKEAKQANEGGQSPKKRRKVEKNTKGTWIEMVNTTSKDEVTAHRAMFTPRDHPGYYQMSDRARNLIVGWVDRGWYETSAPEEEEEEEEKEE